MIMSMNVRAGDLIFDGAIVQRLYGGHNSKVFFFQHIMHGFLMDSHKWSMLRISSHTLFEQYIIERGGEYPTSLWACVTTLYGGHDLCNDIHKLEVSVLAVCGHGM